MSMNRDNTTAKKGENNEKGKKQINKVYNDSVSGITAFAKCIRMWPG